jgi:small subunit ribosomal protein S20
MPVIRSAKKKLKVDKKRESANKKARALIGLLIKKAKKKPTEASVQKAFEAIDKGIKKDIFHKNKGARIKSRLAKLIAKKSQPSMQHKTSKQVETKKARKNKK